MQIRKNLFAVSSFLFLISVLFFSYGCANQVKLTSKAGYSEILPLRERAKIQNDWLRWRFDNILPAIMKEADIDLWLVIQREYDEDPLFFTLVSQPTITSYRTTILILHDKGDGTVERLSASDHPQASGYRNVWTDKSKEQFANLADVIKQINPRKIGIDISENWHLADGLNFTLKQRLENALGPEMSKELVSAEKLCIDWLQTRSPQEIETYKILSRITHKISSELAAANIIKPGVTTTDDVRWWLRQRTLDLGIENWFHPICDIQRTKKDAEKYKQSSNIIHRGDLVHIDFGIKYLGLCTDTQFHFYICRENETDAPEGLKKGLKITNEFGQTIMGEFKDGRNGDEIGKAAMEKAKKAGINSVIYSHSIGTYGHSAGLRLETRPRESAGVGSYERTFYPLKLNTVYAIEFHCSFNVPEWDNQQVQISFEDNAAFTKDGCRLIDGCQQQFFLIK